MGLKSFLFFSPLLLFAIEGYDFEPEIDLIPPKIEEDTLINKFIKPPVLRDEFFSKFGRISLGKELNLRFKKYFNINLATEIEFKSIEKNSFIALTSGGRDIGDKSISEILLNIGRYNISDSLRNYGLVSTKILYFNKMNFEINTSIAYDDSILYDCYLLYKLLENLWLGVSLPKLSPTVRINYLKEGFAFLFEYKNKIVNKPLYLFYIEYPYTSFNEKLKQEYWKRVLDLSLSFKNIFSLDFSVKEIENMIFYEHKENKSIPINSGSTGVAFYLNMALFDKIKLNMEKRIGNRENNQLSLYTFNLTISLLKFSFLPEINYIDREFVSPYNLLNISIKRKIKYFILFIKAENILNKKYEIINGVYKDGVLFQFGISSN